MGFIDDLEKMLCLYHKTLLLHDEGYSHRKIANMLGINRNRAYYWIKGKHTPYDILRKHFDSGIGVVDGVEMIYLAGLIDGDGYITIANRSRGTKKSGRSLSPKIGIGNKDEAIIKFAKRVMGRYGLFKLYRRKGVASWVTLQKLAPVLKLLKEIRPYLISKRKICDLVIEFCERRLKTIAAGGRGAPYTQREIEIFWEVRKLNAKRKGAQSKPFP